MDAYDLSAWRDFAMGLTTAAAALTGLVFVAVSIHLQSVLTDPVHRRRAGWAFLELVSLLGLGLVALFAGITRQAYGVTVVVVAAGLLVRVALAAIAYRDTDVGSEPWVTLSAGLAVYLAMVWAGISLLAKSGGGMYVLATALVLHGAIALRIVWFLFVSISEEGTAAESPDSVQLGIEGDTS